MKRVIPTSDGRLIEIIEGVLRFPLKTRGPRKPAPRKKYFWTRPDGTRDYSQSGQQKFQGEGSWLSLRRKQNADASKEKLGRGRGQLDGLRRDEAQALWNAGIRQAAIDMENIKKNFTFEDASSEEALQGALEVLRTPASQQIKLAAARLVLDFTKIKPVIKSETTVNAAEKWLDSLEPEDTADPEETT